MISKLKLFINISKLAALCSLFAILPQDIMCPTTTASSTSSVMWPTKVRSVEPARHSSFVQAAPQRTSSWLWRMNATPTSWWSPPRPASSRYGASQQPYPVHDDFIMWMSLSMLNNLFLLQQKVEEAEREKEELVKNMALLQQEKEQLEAEKESLQKQYEQEKETCAQLRRENQVSRQREQ